MRNAIFAAACAVLMASSTPYVQPLGAQEPDAAAGEPVSGRLLKNYGDDGGEAPYLLADPETEEVIYEITSDSQIDLSSYDGEVVQLSGVVAPALPGWAKRLTVHEMTGPQLVGAAEASEIAPAQGEIVYEGAGPGEVVYEDAGVYAEPGPDGVIYGDGYLGGPGGYVAPPILGPLPLLGLYPPTPPQGTSFGHPHWYWVRAEYLSWWTSGMDLPPLVTTSPFGTDQDDAGVLGTDGVSILFGGQEYHEGQRSGGRIRFGLWLDPMQKVGIEGEYLGLEQSGETFSATSTGGNPILARPFYNILDFAEDSELVGFPDIIEGTVSVATTGDFEGAAARMRWSLCCPQMSCDACDPCSSCGPSGPGVALTGGYRFYRLDEGVRIDENLTSLAPSVPGSFDIFDSFDSANEFHGGELGMLLEWHGHRWWVEALSPRIVRLDGADGGHPRPHDDQRALNRRDHGNRHHGPAFEHRRISPQPIHGDSRNRGHPRVEHHLPLVRDLRLHVHLLAACATARQHDRPRVEPQPLRRGGRPAGRPSAAAIRLGRLRLLGPRPERRRRLPLVASAARNVDLLQADLQSRSTT